MFPAWVPALVLIAKGTGYVGPKLYGAPKKPKLNPTPPPNVNTPFKLITVDVSFFEILFCVCAKEFSVTKKANSKINLNGLHLGNSCFL